ncbi:hypothetical protein K488DRAFT_75382 [Vararia minispora EC-137]|uniref:Uncharacterized protein n=1 Tax=Vararia minispora EC-137 TaxID=1314806 RepID=A0ACB8Q473_9AGAM|nr:hypothetical protein K488DRAFT_75382 [Vararia minispora EC-137]
MSQPSHPLPSAPQALLRVRFVALMRRELVAIPTLPGPVSSRDLGLHSKHVAAVAYHLSRFFDLSSQAAPFTHMPGLVMCTVALGESWLRATRHVANRDALRLEIASLDEVLDHARGQAFAQIPYASSTLELHSLADDNVLYDLAGALLSDDLPVAEAILDDLTELARLPAGRLPDIFEAYRTALVAAARPDDETTWPDSEQAISPLAGDSEVHPVTALRSDLPDL